MLQALELNLRPRGCAVMIEAEHMCMSLRGIRKHGSSTVTPGLPASSRPIPPSRSVS